MRTPRQHKLDRFAIAILVALPAGYLLPDDTLRDEIGERAHPRPLASEAEDTIRFLEAQGRIHGLRSETGIKWSVTDSGRVWWEINR